MDRLQKNANINCSTENTSLNRYTSDRLEQVVYNTPELGGS